MKRTITIIVIALVVLAFFWASASTASAGYIEDLTIGDLLGPKIPASFRDGVYVGIFHTILSSEAVSCRMMSADMMTAGIVAALQAKEITADWTAYRASLYVLVRAGCTPTTKKAQTNV